MRRKPITLPEARTFTRQTLEEIVAENLKKYRKAAKLSQVDFVAALAKRGYQISLSSYARAEANLYAISLTLLDACAVFYEIAPTVLLIPTNKKRLQLVEVDAAPDAPEVEPESAP